MTAMTQRILIIDDGGELAQHLRAALEQSGYRVLVALDGESAMFTSIYRIIDVSRYKETSVIERVTECFDKVNPGETL